MARRGFFFPARPSVSGGEKDDRLLFLFKRRLGELARGGVHPPRLLQLYTQAPTKTVGFDGRGALITMKRSGLSLVLYQQ